MPANIGSSRCMASRAGVMPRLRPSSMIRSQREMLIAGYLAAKPEMRYTGAGIGVANARLGETHRFKDAEGVQREHTNWHSLVFYGPMAEIAVTYDKGDNLFVENGTIQQRKFTPKDGSERTVHEVIVWACHLVQPRQKGDQPALSGAQREPIQNEELEDWPA